MIQSRHRFGLAASSPNLSESSLARWAAVSGFASAQPSFWLAMPALAAHPPNWIQTNFATRGGPNLLASLNNTQGVWASPQIPPDRAESWAEPQRGSGGRAPRNDLAATTPRGLGRSPSGGLGAEPPATFMRRSGAEPQLPAYMIQSSQPVWSAA